MASKKINKEILKGLKGAQLPRVDFNSIKYIEFLLPPFEEQKVIVAQIEQEEQYVEACKKLIELNKQKISNKIKSIWNI